MNSLGSERDPRADKDDRDDDLLFADEPAHADDAAAVAAREEPADARTAGPGSSNDRWTILIVDDDAEIHDVTRLALGDICFAGRALHFLSAYSGAEACRIAAEHDDIALILLDVVMESEHAGLDVVRYVREQLGNRFTRIVLRTGQPGQAPEKEVIVEYDINDYKAKTELTHQRMFTMVYTSLSSYRDLVALEANRAGLRSVVDASAMIFALHSAERFAHRALEELTALLYLGCDPADAGASAFAATVDRGELSIVTGLGGFSELSGTVSAVAPADACRRIARARAERRSVSDSDHYVAYLGDRVRRNPVRDSGDVRMDSVLYVTGERPFTVPDAKLVELYCRNVAIAMENIALAHDSEETQREIVYLLGEAIEKRSNETGNHVRRVGEYCRLLGRLCGLSFDECEVLYMAAPLHDAGKIAIPDAILNKPGRHTPEETVIMRTHAQHGADLLGGYQRPVLAAAAIIAAQHHEKWDGSGYPRGLAGTDIHLYGRIAAMADVFDALGSDRCYKQAWSLDRILAELRRERGKHFDPMLVDLFLDNLEQFLAIRDRYQDRYTGDS